MFPKFYEDNKSKISFLYTQVLEEKFKRVPTLEVQKNIDVYRSRQEQVDIIENRRQLQKTSRKNKKHDQRSQYDSGIHSHKHFKAKKEFESATSEAGLEAVVLGVILKILFLSLQKIKTKNFFILLPELNAMYEK
jgi:hypothetical protein